MTARRLAAPQGVQAIVHQLKRSPTPSTLSCFRACGVGRHGGIADTIDEPR